MIIRIKFLSKSSNKKFSWLHFSTRFVEGGLPLGKRLLSDKNVLPSLGTYKKSRKDEPTYKRGNRRWVRKFRYALTRPSLTKVRLTSAPPLTSDYRIFLEEQRKLEQSRYRKRRVINFFTDFLGWPNLTSGDRVKKIVNKFLSIGNFANKRRLAREPTEKELQGHKDLVVYHRRFPRYRRWIRSYFRYLLLSNKGIYRPRYIQIFNHSKKFDSFREYFYWSQLARSSILASSARENLTKNDSVELLLEKRLKLLHRKQRAVKRAQKRAKRFALYQKYVLGRLPKKVKRSKKRYYFFRRRRLQRFTTQIFDEKQYSSHITRRNFKRYKFNRFSWLESTGLVQPESRYSTSMHHWVISVFGERVASSLEYTYFKRNSFYTRFRDRKNEDSRRWRIQDNPYVREPLLKLRKLKWSWFNTGLIQKKVHDLNKFKLDNPDDAKKSEIFDSERAPLKVNLFSSMYWSMQKWGRGSHWRPRPKNRGLYVFVKTLRKGFSFEYDADQWSQAATSATGMRYSLLLENELKPDLIAAKKEQQRLELERELQEQLEAQVRLAKIKRWRYVKYFYRRLVLGFSYSKVLFAYGVQFLWFFVFTPLWFIYSMVCKFWLLIWYILNVVAHHFWTPFGMVHIFYKNFSPRLPRFIRKKIRTFIADHRLFRNVRWAYISWLMVYSSEDDTSETEIQMKDDEERNHFLEEDNDNLHGEDFDDLGSSSMTHDEPTLPWRSWWNKEVDSFYDEGLEIARDIILEEIPYHVRLFTHPFVDFFFRLPFWGVLEGLTSIMVALKSDYHEIWYKIMTYGNKEGKIHGRWWKILLISAKFISQLCMAGVLFFWMVKSVDYSSLKLWFLYSLEIPFMDEYYYFWIFFCFVFSIMLVGPKSWKSYFVTELGLDGTLFILFGTSALAFPEEYYTHRPSPLIRTHIADRTLGSITTNAMYLPQEHDRGFGEFAKSRTRFTDYNQFRPAQLKGYNAPPWEYGVDQGDENEVRFLTNVDLQDEFFSDWHNLHQLRWGRDMATRHPHFARNNFYDVPFKEDFPFLVTTWPHYVTNDPRNKRTTFSRSENDSITNFNNE